MTGGNDISLIYPWLNINHCNADIWSWIHREEESSVEQLISDSKHRRLTQVWRILLSLISIIDYCQGTYCIVETVLPSAELDNPSESVSTRDQGEELCVLLGFRTTDDNCVDTVEADSERSQEARSWREWTGIGTLYQNLSTEDMVQVKRIEFLESHLPYHTAVFHYIVLVYLQVINEFSCAHLHVQ